MSPPPPPPRRPFSPPPPQHLGPRSEFRQYTGAPPPGPDRRDPRYRRSLSPPPPPLPPLGLDDYHDGYPRFDIPRPSFQRYNGPPPPPPALYERPRSPPAMYERPRSPPPQALSRGPVRTKTAERPLPPFLLASLLGRPSRPVPDSCLSFSLVFLFASLLIRRGTCAAAASSPSVCAAVLPPAQQTCLARLAASGFPPPALACL